jgi:hypothetical protein
VTIGLLTFPPLVLGVFVLWLSREPIRAIVRGEQPEASRVQVVVARIAIVIAVILALVLIRAVLDVAR